MQPGQTYNVLRKTKTDKYQKKGQKYYKKLKAEIWKIIE